MSRLRGTDTVRCLLLGFALGIIALQQQALLPPPFFQWVAAPALAAGLAATWLSSLRPLRVGNVWMATLPLVALLAAGAAGFGYAAWRAEARLADVLPSEWEGRDITVVGIVDDLPQPVDRGTRFAFSIERVETRGARVPSSVSLAWYAPISRDDSAEPLPVLHAGERWRLLVRLKRPHGTVNPAGFDVEAWLLENDLRATGYVRRDPGNMRLDAFAGRASDYVASARESIRQRMLAALDGKLYAGVIAALAIGDERAIPEAQWRLFNRTGVGHLISISGLHITFFAALVGTTVFWLWRRSHALTTRLAARRAAAIAGVCAAFAYVLLAGFQIPAQRTLYMLAVAAAGLWISRPGTASVVWLWALAIVLAWDPWAGLTPGFWLSFGAVGLLLYIGAGRIGRLRPWREAVRAQIAITVGLVPLMLILFMQVSVVSPLANAVAIPVVTFIVVPLALASIVLPWDLLLLTAHQVFAWLAAFLEMLSALPSAVWQQHAPPAWTALAGMIGVMWLLAPRGLPGRALGTLWLLPLFLALPVWPPAGAFKVTVIDVGQGLAVLVQTHAHAMLYDTGPRYSENADAGNRIIASMLRGTGVQTLDMLVLSHQDTDHSGGALSLLQTVPVASVLSSLPATHPILREREARHEHAQRCSVGQRWTWDGVDFELLHPVEANYANPKLKSNDLSCVVRVAAAHGSILLTGDIEARTEADLVRRSAAALRSDVLVVPHHGSRSSSTQAFIDAVHPDTAVFTPGYRNRFGHPRPEVVDRYAQAGIARFRTDYDGAMIFDFGPNARGVHAQREREARYWRDVPVRAELPPLE